MSHNSKLSLKVVCPMQHDEKNEEKTRKRDTGPGDELASGKEMERIAFPSDSKRMKVDTQPAAESQSNISHAQESAQVGSWAPNLVLVTISRQHLNQWFLFCAV